MPSLRQRWLFRAVSLLLVWLIATADTSAAVYNLHLSTDNQPDYTDLESLVRSATDAWERPEDKCIAIWRWGRRSRRQTSCAGEDGRLIWDPVLHYNSYGAMNCGVISSLNCACFWQLGYRGRYVSLKDHTVCEASWDEGRSWHLFDSSMSAFCYNHAGQIASCQEIQAAQACELSGGKSEPGHYYFYHQAPQCASHLGPDGWRCAADRPVEYGRTLKEGADSYERFRGDDACRWARFGQRYTLNLRPYESYTRYWEPLDRGSAHDPDPLCFRPVKTADRDPNSFHPSIRGNGRWLCVPDLSIAACRDVFYDEAGVALAAEDGQGPRVHPAKDQQPGFVVFKVYAANVITSLQIEAQGQRANPQDILQISVSRDAGLHFQPVWKAEQTGAVSAKLTLRDEVAGVTQCLVKVEFSGAQRHRVGLDSLQLTTTTQVNRLTLPKLVRGANEVVLRADRQVESAELWPPLHEGHYRDTAIDSQGIHTGDAVDAGYKATIGAAANGEECFVMWGLRVPSPITAFTCAAQTNAPVPGAYVSLQAGWQRDALREFHRHEFSPQPPNDPQTVRTLTDVPAGTREAFFRTSFFNKTGGGAYRMAGIQSVLLRVEHQPRRPEFEPFEVTYAWTEHRETGDVTRTHTELVTQLPHRYHINVAGFRDPEMLWVRVNLKGYGPDGRQTKTGYSDQQDVGAGARTPKVAYTWGQPISLGQPYTVSRPASTESKNPDDGGELTNGKVIAPTEYTAANAAVRAATAFWNAGEPVIVTVDLQAAKELAGVRISTHQPNERFCHPAEAAVAVSTDGQTWQPAGTIHHHDLWNPPGDYELWEYDDAPQYRKLPAGGRLAYSFPLIFAKPLSGRYVRFTLKPQAERGLGISELSVYDQITTRQWPQPEIVLPSQAPRTP